MPPELPAVVQAEIPRQIKASKTAVEMVRNNMWFVPFVDRARHAPDYEQTTEGAVLFDRMSLKLIPTGLARSR
jgi:hypothetical protein